MTGRMLKRVDDRKDAAYACRVPRAAQMHHVMHSWLNWCDAIVRRAAHMLRASWGFVRLGDVSAHVLDASRDRGALQHECDFSFASMNVTCRLPDASTHAQGIGVRFNTNVTALAKTDTGIAATLTDGSVEEYDVVMFATGVLCLVSPSVLCPLLCGVSCALLCMFGTCVVSAAVHPACGVVQPASAARARAVFACRFFGSPFAQRLVRARWTGRAEGADLDAEL